MAEFDKAVAQTFAHEGGFANDVFDPGGETMYGISKRSYPEEDIPNLTRERAIKLYRQDFWCPLYDQIQSQAVANELFDFGVNTSAREWPKVAVRVLQESLRYLMVGPMVIDGVFGRRTLEATNSISQDRLLREFRARQAFYYANIVIRAPDAEEWKKRRFLETWLRRVMA